MLTNLISIQYCYHYLTDQIPVGLLLYSHIPTAVVAVLFALFVLLHSKNLEAVILLFVSLFFALWSFFDLGAWFAFLGAGTTMFTWSVGFLFGLLFFFFSYYFLYSFINKRDLPLWQKAACGIVLLPVILSTLFGQNLTLFDASICEAAENDFAVQYLFYAQAAFLVAVIILSVFSYRKATKNHKREIALAGTGVILFLGFFLSASIVANILLSYPSLADYAYNYEIYGLFGMPILLIYLGYLIVRYHAFDLKIFGAQALIATLIVVLGSEFAYATTTVNRVLITVTLLLTAIAGAILIKSVRREIEQREALVVANRGQENLIHVMNHQIKGFITTAKGIFAELSQSDDYGQVPEAAKPLLSHGFEEMNRAVEYVQSILKGASAHSGTLPYDMKPVDIKPIVTGLVSKQKDIAEKTGLSFESNIADGDYNSTGDATLLEEAFKNLITNAIKYNNPKGSVAVTLSRTDGKILFAVKDAGRGISAEDAPNLFKPGGVGKNSIKYNTDASGFGLAFVKPVVEKHQGRVWYVSNSPEEGTTFFVELPI